MIRILLADVRPLLEESVFREKLALVSDIRRSKVERLKPPMERCRSLAAGLLLREGILAAGLDYDDMSIITEEYGKPSIRLAESKDTSRDASKDTSRDTSKDASKDTSRDASKDTSKDASKDTEAAFHYSLSHAGSYEAAAFHYSLSHAGNYAAAAFASNPVGVDIEQMGRIRRPERLQRRILTEEEQRLLPYIFSEDEKALLQSRLIYIWTRKEAYVKATGKGLSADFREIETLGERASGRLTSVAIAEGMWLSVCSLNEAERLGELHWVELTQ